LKLSLSSVLDLFIGTLYEKLIGPTAVKKSNDIPAEDLNLNLEFV